MAERTNPHANLIIGAQDEASPVFDKIKASSQSMAAGVEQAATKAAGAVGGMGDKAAPAAQKLDGITASMIRQVQRLNAELEAGGARNAAYFEKMASVKGADLSAMAPYLADLKKAEAAQRVATTGLDHMGMSAKQTAAALRQVPMQFTDIVVSLQGGQSAMQVFLQQGGQLKDMFGGAGNAARALGGYVMGLVNPYTILAGTVGALAMAYIQGAAESEAYNKSLIMTGNAVGTTAGQLSQMAQAVSQVTGGTVGAAAESLALLAGSSNIATSQFEKITAVATQMERVAGVAIKDTVAQFAELGKEPVAASEKLNASTHYLTAEIYHQIKALEDQGDKAGAAALAQGAYADAMNQRIPALEQNLGILEKAWHGITGAAKSSWNAMLNVGREDSLQTKIDALQAKLNDPNERSNEWDGGKKLERELEIMMRQLAAENDIAARKKESAKQAEASTALSKEAEKSASKQEVHYKKMVQLGAEFAKLTNPSAQDIANFAKAASNQADSFNGAAKAVRAHKDAISEAEKGLALYLELMDKAAGFEKNWAKDTNELRAALDSKGISQQQYNDAITELLKKQPLMVEANKAMEQATKDRVAATVRSINAELDAYYKMRDAIDDVNKSLNDLAHANASEADALVFEAGLMGQNATERSKAIEQYEILAKYKAEAAKITESIADPAVRASMLASLAVQQQQAMDNAARAVDIAAWNSTFDRINESLTDALISAGRDGGAALANVLEQELLAKPFKIILQGALQPVTQGLTNAAVGGKALDMATGGISTLLSSSSMGALDMATGGISTLLSSPSMGALDIAGFSVPQIGLALAGWSVLENLGVFGSNFVSAADTGGSRIDYSAAGVAGNAYLPNGGTLMTDSATSIVEAMAKSYFQTAASLGIKAMAASFEYGSNSGRQGQNPNFGIGVNVGNAGYSSGETPTSEAALSLAASQAVLTALQASELPTYLSGVFDNITASTATQDQITVALSGATALKQFHDALLGLQFQNLAGLSYAATQSLIGFSGSLDALKTNLGTYYTNFYSAEEQRAQTIKNINATVGNGFDAASTDAKEFRATVEAAMLDTSTEGLALTAKLLGVSGAMGALTKESEAAAEALAKTNQGWQDQLDVLTGKETERSIALRDATDESTRAIMRQVYAQEDLVTAAESAKESMTALETARSASASAQSAVEAIRNEATSNYLSATDRVASAQQRIADIQTSALKATEQAAIASAQKLRDVGKSLRGFVEGNVKTPEQAFADTLKKALAGDTEAMQGLARAATAASDLASERSSNVALAQARILADVMRVATIGENASLPTATEDADPMIQALSDLKTAQDAQTAAQGIATTVNASLSAAVDSLVARYAAAVDASAVANQAMMEARTTLTNSLLQLEAINGNTKPLLAQVVNGFAAIDKNTDGILTLAELKAAGLASETAMTDLFNLTDINGDGVITQLEAIRANTLLTANNISASVTQAVTNSNNAASNATKETDLAGVTQALQTAALSAGVAPDKITTGFVQGMFDKLDVDGSRGLSTAEMSSTFMTGAISTLLAQTTQPPPTTTTPPPSATLTAFDNLRLADPQYNVVPPQSDPAGLAVYQAYQTYAFRKPDQNGFNYWLPTYKSQISALGVSAATTWLGEAVKAAAAQWGTTNLSNAKSSLIDAHIGQGMSRLGAETLAARYFANGGAFTNGIVNSPTLFDMGLMGEAGPEAIMPLSRMPNGDLGVTARFSSMQANNEALVAEIRALRQEVAELRKSNTRENTAIASHAALTADSTRTLTRDGVQVWTDPADPIKVAA